MKIAVFHNFMDNIGGAEIVRFKGNNRMIQKQQNLKITSFLPSELSGSEESVETICDYLRRNNII